MARVPITVMGYRCERCSHEWIPRVDVDDEPRVCPKCRSAWWNKPKKSVMAYDAFKAIVERTLRSAVVPLTWTEVRTRAGLPQLFPNNQWVHRLEKDIGLRRRREPNGVIHWELSDSATDSAPKASDAPRAR